MTNQYWTPRTLPDSHFVRNKEDGLFYSKPQSSNLLEEVGNHFILISEHYIPYTVENKEAAKVH